MINLKFSNITLDQYVDQSTLYVITAFYSTYTSEPHVQTDCPQHSFPSNCNKKCLIEMELYYNLVCQMNFLIQQSESTQCDRIQFQNIVFSVVVASGRTQETYMAKGNSVFADGIARQRRAA